MKQYLPLLYIALGGLWVAINRTAQSMLILFAIVVIYFIVSSYRKRKSEPEVLPPEDDNTEFHNDFSKVGSADPRDEKIKIACCPRRKAPPKR